MAEPRYEKLWTDLSPVLDEVAILYFDDRNPVREHFVCYRVAGPERQPRYAVAHMASEDTDFYDYRGAAPAERGLEEYGVYRVHEHARLSDVSRGRQPIRQAATSTAISASLFPPERAKTTSTSSPTSTSPSDITGWFRDFFVIGITHSISSLGTCLANSSDAFP